MSSRKSFAQKTAQFIWLMVRRPSEARAVALNALFSEEKELDKDPSAGFDRASMRRCWELLDLTSRSFATVIKELDGDLCRVVCLFYLVGRGVDTIEDDMTIDVDTKVQLLETFHEKLSTPGWTFNGSQCTFKLEK